MREASSLLVLTALALRPPRAAITAGVSAGCAVIASIALVPGGSGILGGALALLMVLTAAIDCRHYVIPDELTLSAVVLGLVQASVLETGQIADALFSASVRGVIGAMVFVVVRATYRYLRGHDGMGWGDVKLAGAAGVWLDWMTLPLAIEIAALTGLAVYGVRYGFARRRMQSPPKSTIKVPFGLFFAPSIWIGWLLQSHSFIVR